MACFIKVFKHGGDPVKAMLSEKMKGAQYSYSELEKPGWPAYNFVWKKLRFSSHPRAKVRHRGPPGTARAQPCWPVNCWLIGLIICQNKLESFTCEKAQKKKKFNYCKSKKVVSGMKWVKMNIILANMYIWW